MSKKFLLSALTISLSTLLLSACGSDSEDSAETYAHVYNVSPNSTKLTLEFEKDDDGDDDTADYIFSNIDFADASSAAEVDSGTYDVVVSGLDSNLEEEELLTSSLDFANDQRNLVFVSGDYTDLQLQTFSYSIETLNDDEDDDDNMRLYVGDFVSGSTGYELRWSNSSADFEDATVLTTTQAGTVALVDDYETETYNIYVVDPSDDSLLFTAADVSLTGETAYFLILRDSFGPAQSGIALDKVTSSTTVVEYEDNLGNAQYRVLNVAPATVDVSLSYSVLSFDNDNVAQGDATDYTQVGYNDYAVTISENGTPLLSNLALSLPQNITKAIAIYEDYNADDDTTEVKAMSFQESVRPRKYQNVINFINLAYDVEQADVFFVAPGETMDTAIYDFQDVDFEELETGVLPTDEYRVNVVLDLDDDNRIILNQTTLKLEDGKNYTLALFKKQDESGNFDYSILVAED